MVNKKIVIIILSAVLAATVIGAGIFAVVSSQRDKGDGTTTTAAPIDPDNSQNNQQSGDNGQSGDFSQGGASSQTDTPDLSQLILGSWKDSAGMSGYAFYADGTVEMTYVNLTIPVLNWPINGTSKGVYTLEGDQLTTTFSIYSASITDKFTVSVENNTLKMFDHEDREIATYQKEATADSGSTDIPDGTDIGGSWTNGDGSFGYKFNADGTVTVTERSNTYGGVYLTDGDKLTVQYMYGADKVTKRYTYKVSSNNLTLIEGDDMTIFVRKGTSSQHSSSGGDGIYGLWRDGANMSGYEFKDGGVVEITFVNFTVPVINMPINGTYPGSFTVSGDKLTVSYSIYGKNISDTFTYAVTDNTLTLTGSDGNTATYIRQ